MEPIKLIPAEFGKLIPQKFAELYKEQLTETEYAILTIPEHRYYNETWMEVLDRVRITDEYGDSYELFEHEGSLYAIPEGRMLPDEFFKKSA